MNKLDHAIAELERVRAVKVTNSVIRREENADPDQLALDDAVIHSCDFAIGILKKYMIYEEALYHQTPN